MTMPQIQFYTQKDTIYYQTPHYCIIPFSLYICTVTAVAGVVVLQKG
jgi:hypothetical protein